jgi:Asp-tRNA(Asn)/Glu-tRNA(Gln) amidotransferase A subunit family amidase
MTRTRRRVSRLATALPLTAAMIAGLTAIAPRASAQPASSFKVEEATIADIQQAILDHKLTSTELVKLYLARIKAFNGKGVEEPDGLLKPIKAIPHAKGVNALCTLNLRPATREAMGFDAHYARSMTNPADNDPSMPDALEVAAAEDAAFAKTGKLVGPLHGVVIAIKDQFDTFDMRTTSGADAAYANDRPPHDSTFAQKLREAGAIVLAKSAMGEYAGGYGGNRSSFGGTVVNPYDTLRQPGSSSAGSGAAVAANLVTCAIGEETSPSIRAPAQNNNLVGISPTQELVSRVGMMNIGINTRIGPICRTVEDAARILTVIAGYDPKDEMTAFNVGRTPDQPYESFTHEKSLQGVRIGVLSEYLDPKFLGKEGLEHIRLARAAIEDLRRMGATVIDRGPDGLLTEYIRRYNPMLSNLSWTKLHPELFPVDDEGKPTSDQVLRLVAMAMDPSKVPTMTLRDFSRAEAIGETKYGYELYLAQRGDSNIKTLSDLIGKAKFYEDGADMRGKPATLITANAGKTMDTSVRLQRRFAIQQIVLQCMAELKLDAIVAPTGGTPPPLIGAPSAGRAAGGAVSNTWSFLGQQGIPAITVPMGFADQVYDRVVDPTGTPPPASPESRGPPVATKLVGPVATHVPLGIDFMGRPFSEPMLLKIAAAYEAATHHREEPADFAAIP